MDRPKKLWGWLRISLAFVVVGILFLVMSIPPLANSVVAHETVPLSRTPVELGPYHLETGTYFVWIEDFLPGPDDYDHLDIEVTDQFGLEDSAYHTNSQPDRRTIDGVETEQGGGFDIDSDGDYVFNIEAYGVTSDGEPVHVYIVRHENVGAAIGFSIGAVCLSFGLIATGLLQHARKHR